MNQTLTEQYINSTVHRVKHKSRKLIPTGRFRDCFLKGKIIDLSLEESASIIQMHKGEKAVLGKSYDIKPVLPLPMFRCDSHKLILGHPSRECHSQSDAC